jgi:hypothetical protein
VNVGIVVSRYGGHPVGRPDALEPGARLDELVLECDVGEIAGHGDLMGRLVMEILDQGLEDVGAMRSPPADLPGEPARGALAEQRQHAARLHWRGVQIRDVGERDDVEPLGISLTQPQTL